MLKKTLQNGITIESFSLMEHQFERACQLCEKEGMASEFDSLSPSNLFLETWLGEDSPMDSDEKEWLQKMVDEGADIYTYNDGWQSIGEVAVWN